MPDKERVRGWKVSAARALESAGFWLDSRSQPDQQELVEQLLERSAIIELDALDQGAKKFLIPVLCLWLYYVRLAGRTREELQHVLFVEEAHHVLFQGSHRSRETVMNQLLRQCRETGMAFVVVDQHPHLISSAALGNTYTTICLNQKDPKDIEKAAGLSLLGTEDKNHLSMLPVGQGVVKLQDRWRRSFLVQFPLIEVPKGAVTDELLERFLSGSTTLSGLKRAVGGSNRHLGRSRGADTHLQDTAFKLVEDIAAHADDGVDARYKRLGWSVDKGNRIKGQLLDSGLLQEEEVPVGRTRRRLLRVTATAKADLGLDGVDGRGGIAHEYWKRQCARRFEERGYVVQLEAPRSVTVRCIGATLSSAKRSHLSG